MLQTMIYLQTAQYTHLQHMLMHCTLTKVYISPISNNVTMLPSTSSNYFKIRYSWYTTTDSSVHKVGIASFVAGVEVDDFWEGTINDRISRRKKLLNRRKLQHMKAVVLLSKVALAAPQLSYAEATFHLTICFFLKICTLIVPSQKSYTSTSATKDATPTWCIDESVVVYQQ